MTARRLRDAIARLARPATVKHQKTATRNQLNALAAEVFGSGTTVRAAVQDYYEDREPQRKFVVYVQLLNAGVSRQRTLMEVVTSPYRRRPEKRVAVLNDTRATQRETTDCVRCAVATLLALPYHDVPAFEEHGPGAVFAAIEWAQARGLIVDWGEDDPGIRCLGIGQSPRRDVKHAVVWDGGLTWDPHPSRAGLVGEPTLYVTMRNGGGTP